MISNKDILVGAVKSRRSADCYLNESRFVNETLGTVWSVGLASQVRRTLVPRAPRTTAGLLGWTGAGPRERSEPPKHGDTPQLPAAWEMGTQV